jgi:16S rRNA (uracil1498-N3)-methyltransferase
MAAGRFYIAGLVLAPGKELELPAEIAHQARDVLRLVVGNALNLLDGAGGVCEAQLIASTGNRVSVRLGEPRTAPGMETPIRLVLCQSLLKAAKYEIVLQKCTELGVAGFVPLVSERAVAAIAAGGESKQRRWGKIVAEAMEQCGGTYLPELVEPQTLQQALEGIPPGGVALVPFEGERETTLRSAVQTGLAGRLLSEIPEIRIFIGPEGGFSAAEVALLERYAATTVTLGRRILRAETASIVAVTLALDSLGSFDEQPGADRRA